MEPGPRIRTTVWFSGRVQGVGFRYTACGVARHFEISGYVQNLPDGRVEAVIEGGQGEVERFLAALRSEMHGNIRGEQRQDSSATGEYVGFDVRH
jgi:acylphosphatase